MTWTFTPKRAAALSEARRKKATKQTQRRQLWPLGSSRRMGRYTVYTADDGRPYVLSKRVDGKVSRKFGEVRSCDNCGGDMFRLRTGRGEWTNCSTRCGRHRLKRTKRAASLAKGGPKKEVLDAWFSRIVRNVGECAHCGAGVNLQCAHIVGRRYLGVRYDRANAVCLCAKCHMYFTYRPIEWEDWVTARIGADAYQAIRGKARDFVGPFDRLAVARELYAEADRLGFTQTDTKQTGYWGWKGLRDPDALRSAPR